MQVRSHGQVFQKSSPRTGKRTRTIEAHRLVSAKHRSSRQRQSQIFLDVRKDHLRCKSTRGDMVSPPQAIDVASQTFAPDGLDCIGSKAVQPTAFRHIAFLKGILTPSQEREKTHGKDRGVNHAYPTFSSPERASDGSS